MERITENLLSLHAQPGQYNFPNFVVMAMRAVEEYALSHSDMTGLEKSKMAQNLLPDLILTASKMDLIDADDASNYIDIVNRLGDGVQKMMDLFISISKNPAYIQLTRDLAGCFCRQKRLNPKPTKRPRKSLR